jgi:Protein of unknown function (DUF3102)
MAIDNPILGFTLSRTEAIPPTLLRDEEWDEPAQRETERAELASEPEFEDNSPPLNYDYSGVPAKNVAEISVLVSRIRASRKRHVEAVQEIGANLLRAKHLLGHGNFLPWLQAEFRWSERTANNYMSIARFFKGKTANFADLDIGAASALAAKSTPSEIRTELMERIEAGESISREEVKERLAAGKTARKKVLATALQNGTSEAARIDQHRDTLDLPQALVEFEKTFEVEPPARPIHAELGTFGGESAHPMDDLRARDAVDAILAIESTLERLCSRSPSEAAHMLLSVSSEQEQIKVQKIISLVLQLKQAMDDHVGFLNDPASQPAA